MTVAPFDSVDALLAALAAGANAYDEPNLNVLSHSLQCGHILRSEQDDLELAVAGLVHDVWDAVEPGDHADHAARGAALVASLFGRRVAFMVAGHVHAKRYLVAVNARYRNELSDRSAATLGAQGNAMTADEARAFEELELFDALVALRLADERAKVDSALVPPLPEWRDLLSELAATS